MCWFHAGSTQKSNAELDTLVKGVLLRDDFNTQDLRGFSTKAKHTRLDNAVDSKLDPKERLFPLHSGWERRSVKLALPAPKIKQKEADAPVFEVSGVMMRPLLAVMTEAFQGPEFQSFHITPFEECWDPLFQSRDRSSMTPASLIKITRALFTQLPPRHQWLYNEIYTSRKMMAAYHLLPADPNVETIIAAFMFWSDSTHLANFGTASLWPLYTFFGNCSKYSRLKPSLHHCHHQAYIPPLPDTVNDYYHQTFGKPPSAAMLTHLKRELLQGVWDLLISAEFITAYVHGINIKCYDGVKRLVYPQIFTYGADYPEKTLLATIRYLGGCPCPRCLITKANIRKMGMVSDMKARLRSSQRRVDSLALGNKIEAVRRYLFRGALVNGTKVDGHLKAMSLTPTRNAFSKLRAHGFNVYEILVPDLLHEFELGVWKAVFTHLVRILHSIGHESILKLNQRYRSVPTFGRSVIRQFHEDAASMKKLAARDFEDFLLCAIPVFEGLFSPSDGKIILDLLFALSTWHGLAKLRVHTDDTIRLLSNATMSLGVLLRKFTDKVCPGHETKDLPREVEARARRARKLADNSGNEVAASGSKLRQFNLTTYKMHALGDYVEAIQQLGTSESWSTQIGKLEHHCVKRLYTRTNKNNHAQQIARQEQRQRLLRDVAERLDQLDRRNEPESDPVNTALRFWISTSHQEILHIGTYLTNNVDDTAFTDFLPKLQAHLLARILGLTYTGDEHDFSPQQFYDNRRCEETLNPRTNSDFMTTSHDPRNLFWYGRILNIFHVVVHHPELAVKKRMDFLWVRWFGIDESFTSGWRAQRLHRIGFVPASDESAFSFLDPAEIIRAVHLIPAFAHGETAQPEPSSSVASISEAKNKGKWNFYYVGMFADRDLLMRHLGGGVGHMTRGVPGNTLLESEEDDIDVDDDTDAMMIDEEIASGSEGDFDSDVELSEEEISVDEDEDEDEDDGEDEGVLEA
ncbi:hypothetical protein PLEOSDRAFT_1074586 [Pleurotus ostreatus PC15]|uniref:Uncharacterized protein n=2 Tax=Pleurotus TaxID=5320 RepID=A0A067NSH2_PLEO1|nr:hypothetical protein PLEOSDRAFT_1074586 [Pleurotus ostreatus PC15]